MTSTFAPFQAIARAQSHAGAGMRALGVVATLMAMRKVVVTASRSPAQGPPALR